MKQTKRNRRRNMLYLLKMLILFLMDVVLAAGVVFGSYYLKYKLPKNAGKVDVIVIQTEPESTQPKEEVQTEDTSSLETTTEADQAHATTEPASEETKKASSEETTQVTTEETTETPTEPEIVKPGIERLTWTEKYLDHFTETPTYDANHYSDQHISVDVTTEVMGEGSNRIVYYVADIYVADIHYFGSKIVEDDVTLQTTTPPWHFASMNPQDILFTNGDYVGRSGVGMVVRNGIIYRQVVEGIDQCALLSDGTMKICPANTYTVEQCIADNAWQVWCFGPSLLDAEGHAKTSFETSDYLMRAHPRTAIGYYEPGHYCLVVIDGRAEGYSRGMTMSEMSQMFEKLGCKVAYNLDGGGSSTMYFEGTVVNQDTERYVSDFIVVSTTPL